MIKNKIKVVFWDLDDTLWKGTFAENDNVTINKEYINVVKELNKRGIVNSICSKNDYEKAKQKCQELEIWDEFVFSSISFSNKGEMIKQTLNQMNLRAENALFVDDNEFNLNEVEFVNNGISTLLSNENIFSQILDNKYCEGKDDSALTRLKQYKELESKTLTKKNFSSDKAFLIQSNIRIYFINFSSQFYDRLYELIERTNQLNYTKNRMNKSELDEMLSDTSVTTQLIHVVDNYSDYGIVGFYSIKDGKIIHFVFSCRIMNMGIEQYVWAKLGFPEFKIVGEVATNLIKDEIPNYITELKYTEDDDSYNINNILNKETELEIFAIGACDLYHPISYFSMPNQNFIYECNMFNGHERGTNVGTEYIRSIFEMDDKEKEYCQKHFMNYQGSFALNTQIFAKDYDYVIMSFHDDMITKIYEKKDDPNLRIIRMHERIFGDTSVVDNGQILNNEQEAAFLEYNFKEPYYISPERFKENMEFILEKSSEKTKFILITGPELDFFREKTPKCPEAREQILKINKAIIEFSNNHSDRTAIIDINSFIRSKNDITNYIFHLKADTAYKLFLGIALTIFKKFRSSKKPMLEHVRNNREVVIFGYGSKANNAYINLLLGGEEPKGFCYISTPGLPEEILDARFLIGNKDKYYVVIADDQNCNMIAELLELYGYTKKTDFVKLAPRSYKQMWNECESKF